MQPDAVTLTAVLRLAIPAMATGVLQAGFRPVDQYFVQGLGVAAQGALGATTLVSVLAFALCQLVSAGVGPWVGRLTGANDPDGRRDVIEQSLGACAVIAVALAVVGFLGAVPLVRFLGLEGEGAAHAVAYLRVLFVTGPALVFGPTVDASFHAMGDTRLPLRLQAGAVALNLVLTPPLVAAWGTAGAALGSTIAQSAVTGVGLWVLSRRLGLRWRRWIPGARVAGIMRVGAPIAATTGMFAFVYWLLMATTIRELGQDVYAGLGLGFGVMESLSWPAYSGVSVAAASLVGRALGAGHPELAWRAAWVSMVPALGLGVANAALYWFAGPAIMDVFAEDPAAWREGVRYAALLAIVQPLVAIEAVTEGVLGGAGDTRKVLFTNVPLNLTRVPLAWLFAITLGLGPAGLWWAVNASTLGKAIVKVAWVWHGGWMRRQLRV